MNFKKESFLKEAVKIVVPLIIIAGISGGIIAGVFSATKQKIEYQNKKRIETAIFSILPETKKIEETETASRILYKCKDEKGDLIAVAFIAVGPGYQDVIKVLVVADKELNVVKGIEILESVETPGLGAKINELAFKSQFEEAAANFELSKEFSKKEKDKTVIQAITGATISSRAVVDIVNAEIAEIKKIIVETNK
ncbi:MAG: FMN-binding protein [Candidatus Omnitrophota bacterium]